MKRYLYNYQTIVTFSEPVSAHSVMLRCQPAANAFQTIEQEHVVASPDYWLTAGTDAFGNRILFGGSIRCSPTSAPASWPPAHISRNSKERTCSSTDNHHG